MSMFEKLRSLFRGGSPDRGGSPEEGPGDGAAAMISCEDALRVVHEFLDGELEDTSAEEVKQHFDMCQRCYPHLQLETAFREAVRRATVGETAPPELRDKVTALLAEARTDG